MDSSTVELVEDAQGLFAVCMAFVLIIVFTGIRERKKQEGKDAASLWPLWVLGIYVIIQGILGRQGFYSNYTDPTALNPRVALMLGPGLVMMVFSIVSKPGRWIAKFDWTWLYAIHAVRIPVEIGLMQLHKRGLVPEALTWEGINYDIYIGIGAVVMIVLMMVWKQMPGWLHVAFHGLGLVSLVNIMRIALTTTPGSPLYTGAGGMDNVAVLIGNIVWLPSVIVPVVAMAHIGALRKVIPNKRLARK